MRNWEWYKRHIGILWKKILNLMRRYNKQCTIHNLIR